MFFRRTAILLERGRWGEDEISIMRNLYDRYGPVWNIIATHLRDRKTKECRYWFRFYENTPPFDQMRDVTKQEKALYQQGAELRNGQWYIIPDEDVGIKPHFKLAADLPSYSYGSRIRNKGLSDDQLLVLRACYEYFGTNWERIQKSLKGWSGAHCKLFMSDFFFDDSAELYLKEHREKLEKELDEYQGLTKQ